MKHMNTVDAVGYVTSIYREPKFEEAKRDIESRNPTLNVPIILMGLDV